MSRIVRCSLIQASNAAAPDASLEATKKAMIDKHVDYIRQAAEAGAQIVCLQEIFYGPYFCAEQTTTLVRLHRAGSRRPHHPPDAGPGAQAPHRADRSGLRSGAGGRLLQHRRRDPQRRHVPGQIPQDAHPARGAGLLGEVLLPARAIWAIPVFDLGFAKIGVYICYDRHFPEGARALGLNGAEIVFNPSATVAGLSEYLWKLEQPAHAVANGYFIGAINRVGIEAPWNIGEFYGSSYFCDPRGQIIAQASRDKDEVLTADLDLDLIAEVRKTWQFFRDRRPDMYEALVKAMKAP